MAHAVHRKATFDKKVKGKPPGEVIFEKGQLVQVYRSDLDYTFKAERKLLPKWSVPHRITARNLNSYQLETVTGESIEGNFSARRLRRFYPREGTNLAREQEEVERRCWEEKAKRREEEEKGVMEERERERDSEGSGSLGE